MLDHARGPEGGPHVRQGRRGARALRPRGGHGREGGGRARGLRRDRREGVVEGAPPPLGRRVW